VRGSLWQRIPFCRHPPILASEEQLGLTGLTVKNNVAIHLHLIIKSLLTNKCVFNLTLKHQHSLNVLFLLVNHSLEVVLPLPMHGHHMSPVWSLNLRAILAPLT
jgi:hypothetical protein